MKNIVRLITCVFIISLWSCQSEVDKFDPIEFIAPGDFNDALDLVQDLKRVETLTNEIGASIMMQNGVINLPAHAFVSLSGEPIEGEVELSIIEIGSNKDMIKYDISTADNNGALLSAEAMVYLEAKQNDLRLKLNSVGENGTVYFFDENPQTCSIYNRSTGLENNAWFLDNGAVTKGVINLQIDGLPFDTTGYRIELKNLNWISLQKELAIASYSELCLELTDSNTPNNTRAYIMFDNVNSCQRLQVSSSANCALTNVPVEFEGKLVVFAHKGPLNGEAQIEVESHRVIINSGPLEFDLTPTRVDEAMFVDFFRDL